MDKVKMAPSEPVEQGFNEDELANIMSEIEDLEKEFMSEPAPAPSMKEEPVVASPVDDAPHMVEQDPELEVEQMAAISDAPEESPMMEAPKPIAPQDVSAKKTDLQEEIDRELNNAFNVTAAEPLVAAAPSPAAVHQMPKPAPVSSPAPEMVKHPTFNDNSEKSRMSFHVQGNMSMELSFSFGENEVIFTVQEDEGFVIEMGNGAKFTIPFHSFSHSNKKAS